jgi:hypothetical protein
MRNSIDKAVDQLLDEQDSESVLKSSPTYKRYFAIVKWYGGRGTDSISRFVVNAPTQYAAVLVAESGKKDWEEVVEEYVGEAVPHSQEQEGERNRESFVKEFGWDIYDMNQVEEIVRNQPGFFEENGGVFYSGDQCDLAVGPTKEIALELFFKGQESDVDEW